MLQLLISPLQYLVALMKKLAMPDVTAASLTGWVATSLGMTLT